MYFKTKSLVKQALTEFEKVRDDDNILIGNIVKRIEGKNLNSMSAIELLNNMEKGLYGALESITRSRRKHQEVSPDLRGSKWESRHKYQNAICEQLEFWDKTKE